MVFVDRATARRLERAEGAVAAAMVEARARLEPASGATWRDFGGALALCDGPESPITQVFGLGLGRPVDGGLLDEIEAFFTERGCDTQPEMSPLAGVAAYAALAERGYRPMELSNVLVRALDAAGPDAMQGVRVRIAEPHEEAAWVETGAAGWGDSAELAATLRGLLRVTFANPAMIKYVAEIDGAPVATAGLGLHDGIALLAGASTAPSARGRGAHRALLARRLADARRRGCDLAMMASEPGSTSQGNAQHNGFLVAYSRTKWRRAR